MKLSQLNETLSQSKLDKFEDYLKDKYDLKTLFLSKSRDGIELTSLIVNDKKQGTGTKVMQELIDFADKENEMIGLSVGQKDDGHGTTSRARLVKFYKRFGFVENKGRNKDYSMSFGMFRIPNET